MSVFSNSRPRARCKAARAASSRLPKAARGVGGQCLDTVDLFAQNRAKGCPLAGAVVLEGGKCAGHGLKDGGAQGGNIGSVAAFVHLHDAAHMGDVGGTGRRERQPRGIGGLFDLVEGVDGRGQGRGVQGQRGSCRRPAEA